MVQGYKIVTIDMKIYKVHRICWALYNDKRPPVNMFIDHIDRDKANNKKSNLRLVTHAENLANRSDNKSGAVGITLTTQRGNNYWFAKIQRRGIIHATTFPHSESGKRAAIKWLNQFKKPTEKSASKLLTKKKG